MTGFQLTPCHFLDEATWLRLRPAIRAAGRHLRNQRRIALTPQITLCFETPWTLWYQIQSMLAVEKGGAEQLADELDAWNSMIPGPGEWTATLMIEVPDPEERARVLQTLVHVEDCFQILAGQTLSPVQARPVDPEGRTRDGKTSSVHFLRWALPPGAYHSFASPPDLAIRCTHALAPASLALPRTQRDTLWQDMTESLERTSSWLFQPLSLLTSTTP